MLRLLHIALALPVLLAPAFSAAQTTIAYRNGDGAWEWLKPGETPVAAPKSGVTDEAIAGVFSVTYEDVSLGNGIGFDDPTSGTARREVLHSVLTYVASVLDVPGTADLLVRESQNDGGGPLAAAGPYIVRATGFQGGLVFEHLTTGVDSAPNVLDGTITVDFGFPWSTDAAGPAPNELDLYSTLLHEATHALGFLSLVGSDGSSELGNEGDRGIFSLFDAFLVRGSTGNRLFLAGGEIGASGQDVTSGDVLFSGPRAELAFGSFPNVFAPSTFRPGSSIGHWSFATSFDAVMLPGVGPGEVRRRYTTWELQVLGDLGYEVSACAAGFDAGADDCPPSPPLESDAGVPDEPPSRFGEPGGTAPFRDTPPLVPSTEDDDGVEPSPSASGAGCAAANQDPPGPWSTAWLLALLLVLRAFRSAARVFTGS
jgi:hypothetical protein